MTELLTERLLLRQWRDEDLEPFARMNADAEVMRYFPARLSRAESDAMVSRVRTRIAERGWGLWAVEVVDQGAFIGFVGLSDARFDAHFTPAIEVGWRLTPESWGNGYASEAARAALAFGFTEAGLQEIVSFTAVDNVRSQQVMQRIGMVRDPADDFERETIADPRLRQHVLFRLARDRWQATAADQACPPAP